MREALIQEVGRFIADADADASSTHIDWDELLVLAAKNRLMPLLHSVRGDKDTPAEVRQLLASAARKSMIDTTLHARALFDVQQALTAIPWVLLRGPALGAVLYGKLMLRPYNDLDILVTRANTESALAALRSVGFEAPPFALSDQYYLATHLHVILVRPNHNGDTVLELHWALDHPFTTYSVDVDQLIKSAEHTSINGVNTPIPEPTHLLITLALHTVKHSVRLRYYLDHGLLTQVVDEGELLHLFDIALLLYVFKDRLDWSEVAEISRQWGADVALRDCLDAVEHLWPNSVGAEARLLFSYRGVSRLRRWLYGRMSEDATDVRSMHQEAVFRPVRLLDSLDYLFPSAEYLKRRHGAAHFPIRIQHTLQGAISLLRAGLVLLVSLLGRRNARSEDITAQADEARN